MIPSLCRHAPPRRRFRGNRVVTKVLVQWKHQLPEDATWKFFGLEAEVSLL